MEEDARDRRPEAVEAAGARIPGWARSALSAGILAACAALLFLGVREKDLPVGDPVPAFSFVDQDAQPFGLERLRGKVWVASFIFTRCRDTCPGMTGKLLLVEDAVKATPELSGDVHIVSFSVDPERDKPRDLKAYARSYGADTSVWHFLTGEKGAVEKLSQEGFRLPLGRTPLPDGGGTAPDIIHSDRFALVDREGRLRGYYSSDAEGMKRLIADLKRLVAALAAVP